MAALSRQEFQERTRDQRIKDNTPFDVRWQWEVVLSELSAASIAVAFVVRLYADKNGECSSPSLDAIQHATKLSRNTVLNALHELNRLGLISRHVGVGRTRNSYSLVIPSQTLTELATVYDIRSGSVIEPQGRSGSPTEPLEEAVVVHPLNHKAVVVQSGGRSGSPTEPNIKDNIKDIDTSLRSVSHAAGGVLDPKELVWGPCLDWLVQASKRNRRTCASLIGKWAKTLTWEELHALFRSAYKSAPTDPISYIAAVVDSASKSLHNVRRENGRIKVFNGFAADLTAMLKGRDLQLAITQVEGRIPLHVIGLELETRVRSGIAEIVARSEEQDRRYAAAKASSEAVRATRQDDTSRFFEGAL